MTPKSQFLQILTERGFIHQCTDLEGLDALLAKEKITAYIGFDCTAPSLHVGSLMQIMVLRWMQKCGHKPIVLMGGGTTKIGDPSGKDEARKILTDAEITANLTGIRKNFEPFLHFAPSPMSSSGSTRGSSFSQKETDPRVEPEDDNAKAGHNSNAAVMMNNDDWLKNLNLVEFLRDYGRHFSVNRMLSLDSVKLRLEREHHLSFLEFNYMILQSYDFVELSKRYACRLQIGGSDQWGNIINGIELYKKLLMVEANRPLKHESDALIERITDWALGEQNELFGLTTPLITTASGAKMGKTAAGAVWLNADMLSPYDYWQFWRNTEDADVWKFMRFFTELDIAEIARMERDMQGAQINEAKKILATEATKLCHGEAAALAAAETARQTFEQGLTGDALPEFTLERAALADGSLTPRSLLLTTGFAESNGDAKKLIAGGGVSLNDEKVADANLILTEKSLNADGFLKLSKGKKHHVVIKFK